MKKNHWIKDKVAIVIGGASGIGRSIIRVAAENGARVIIGHINDDLAKQLISNINSEYSPIYIKTDASKPEQVKLLVEKAASIGDIRYLANSAGIQTYGTAETTTLEDWNMTMDVNLKSIFLSCKEVIPHLKKNGGGSIVNISSVQGIRCQKNVLAYSTSKAAAIALTRSMALDHASEDISINCICPGSIDTPLLRFGASQHGPVEEILNNWGSKHPIGRIGTPDEIAKIALFLWSPEAKFIVGQPIIADGGLGSIIL